MMITTMSLLLLLVPGEDPNEGHKAFQSLESALSKAKTLSFTFEAAIDPGPGAKFSGSVAAAGGNKAHLELSGESQGKPGKMVMVSDGTKMRITNTGQNPQSQDTPKKLDDMIRAMVARSGVLLPIFMVEPVQDGQKPKEFNVDEQLKVSDFKLGTKAKVGDREAQVLEYKLTARLAKEPFAVTVWLDPKTNLPLKRTITGDPGGQKMTISETYDKVALDEKIDEKKFEVPK